MGYKVYREVPILFKGNMVNAIIAGKKHKTRRLEAPWNVGDHLWVREMFRLSLQGTIDNGYIETIAYRADGDSLRSDTEIPISRCYSDDFENMVRSKRYGYLWRPSIFMPRWASRITLEVTEKYQEKLQDITDYECIEEGIEYREEDGSDIRDNFAKLWDSINMKRKVDISTNLKTVYPYSWDANPVVFVTGFKVLDIKGK